MEKTMIDRLHDEHQELTTFLLSAGEVSLLNNADTTFRKALILSTASFFEVQIRSCLIEFFTEKSGNDEAAISFLRNKAIERQYHTYFNWKDNNANTFFGLFGNGFKEFMKSEIKDDKNLEASIKSFLELGELRNLLVHQNYAEYPIEKTQEEIFEMYRKAVLFVRVLPSKLREFSRNANQEIN
jgi:arsenate reductase-like glutaredoxin family protein